MPVFIYCIWKHCFARCLYLLSMPIGIHLILSPILQNCYPFSISSANSLCSLKAVDSAFIPYAIAFHLLLLNIRFHRLQLRLITIETGYSALSFSDTRINYFFGLCGPNMRAITNFLQINHISYANADYIHGKFN